MDVEALAAHGARRSLCAYYGARAALPEADLVLLPYGALLTEVRLQLLHDPALSACAMCLRRKSVDMHASPQDMHACIASQVERSFRSQLSFPCSPSLFSVK